MLDVIEVSQRVEEGADFLTELLGNDWPERVPLPHLNIRDGDMCVVAWVTKKEFGEGIVTLYGLPYEDCYRRSIDHGFTLGWGEGDENDDGGDDEWDMLQSAWVGLITVRRSREKAGA